jgi:hypothetical protein
VEDTNVPVDSWTAEASFELHQEHTIAKPFPSWPVANVPLVFTLTFFEGRAWRSGMQAACLRLKGQFNDIKYS